MKAFYINRCGKNNKEFNTQKAPALY